MGNKTKYQLLRGLFLENLKLFPKPLFSHIYISHIYIYSFIRSIHKLSRKKKISDTILHQSL